MAIHPEDDIKTVQESEPVQYYDLLSIVMLCLGGPDGENYGGVLRMLDVLLSHETSEVESMNSAR